MPKLIIKEKGVDRENIVTFDRDEMSIGRIDSNNVVLDSSSVSRRHAQIFPEGKDFYIIDIESAGGTRLNGMLIPKKEKYILKHNDVITIDKYDLRFHLLDELLTQSFNDVTDSDILEVKLLKKVLRALDKESIPSIEVLNGLAEGKKIFITEDIQELVIGRDPMVEFQIEEYVISRKHARIAKKWGGIMIQDLDSKNGVYINNRKVTEEFLHDGDRVALGTIILMFRNPKEVNIEEISKQVGKKAEPESPLAKIEKPVKEPESEPPSDEDVSMTSGTLPEEEQEQLVKDIAKKEYPTPHTKKQKIKFSLMELSFMGLGILVLIFGIIMIVRIIFS